MNSKENQSKCKRGTVRENYARSQNVKVNINGTTESDKLYIAI